MQATTIPAINTRLLRKLGPSKPLPESTPDLKLLESYVAPSWQQHHTGDVGRSSRSAGVEPTSRMIIQRWHVTAPGSSVCQIPAGASAGRVFLLPRQAYRCCLPQAE